MECENPKTKTKGKKEEREVANQTIKKEKTKTCEEEYSEKNKFLEHDHNLLYKEGKKSIVCLFFSLLKETDLSAYAFGSFFRDVLRTER